MQSRRQGFKKTDTKTSHHTCLSLSASRLVKLALATMVQMGAGEVRSRETEGTHDSPDTDSFSYCLLCSRLLYS